METGLLVALAGAVALLSLLLGALLGVALSGRRLERALAASRADVETLRARLEELEASRPVAAATPVVPPAEFVITNAGDTADRPQVPDRAVLSVTLGEPLVKAVAFGYGLRRALSAESRNRIAFEMRREVRRARKQRRRETRRVGREAARGVRREAAA